MSGDSASESRDDGASPIDAADAADAVDAVETGGVDETGDAGEVPDRLLTLAFEFAVGIAAASAKMKSPLAIPAALRPFLRFQKLPANAHAKVRAVVDGDDAFRTALARAAAAAPELLDEPSLLWLTRPAGWRTRLASLVADADAGDLAAELRRSERRREAAEGAAHRVLAEVTALRAELDRRTDVSSSSAQEIERLRRDLTVARTEVERHQSALRRAGEQVRAADERTERVVAERDAALARAAEAERIRDEVLASRASGGGATVELANEAAVLAGADAVAALLEDQALVARRLGVELDRLTRRLRELEPTVNGERPSTSVERSPRPAGRAGRGRGTAPQRMPIAVPGGLYGDSLAAAEHVVRYPNAVVIVDGYNVAKLRFPTLALPQQRERCIDLCEDVARRWGTNIVVVFDATNAAGIAGSMRRLVRVTYSPEGVIADDVIRAEVAALPADVPVVVVTNDQAVVVDVRAMGANPVSSDRFLELAAR